MQLEVSTAYMQVTVSAANMLVTIFIVIMQMGVSVVIMQVVVSAVHYAHDCVYCNYAGDFPLSLCRWQFQVTISYSLTDSLFS